MFDLSLLELNLYTRSKCPETIQIIIRKKHCKGPATVRDRKPRLEEHFANIYSLFCVAENENKSQMRLLFTTFSRVAQKVCGMKPLI